MRLPRLNRFKRSSHPLRTSLFFEKGLHGFEELQFFSLIGKEDEAPFFWLKSTEKKEISFVLIDPFLINPDYDPQITKTELGSNASLLHGDFVLFAIVNINQKTPTANLSAPLLIHWDKKMGKQLLLPGESTNYPISFSE